MNAGDTAELSRLAHKYGGLPIGSFSYSLENVPLELLGHKFKRGIKQCKDNKQQLQIMEAKESASFVHNGEVVFPVEGSSPHALFMDCTHDNETPHQKRTANDTLPNGKTTLSSSEV